MAAELAARYQKASRKERGVILDGFCLAIGYHRKYAIAVLRGLRRAAVRRRVPRAVGTARSSSGRCWWPGRPPAASARSASGPSSPSLSGSSSSTGTSASMTPPEVLIEARVSTVERALAPQCKRPVGRRMAQTKPGTLLCRQIPALVRVGPKVPRPAG